MVRRWLLVASVSLSVLAGCGGGDDEDSESEDPTTAFREEGSAICHDAARETVDVQLDLGQVDLDPDQDLEQAIRFEELSRSANDQLAALEPPAGLAGEYAEYLDDRTALNTAIADRVEALQAGDFASSDAALVRTRSAEQRSLKVAESLGLEGCDNVLPADQKEDIEETVAEIASSRDGDHVCGELVYPAFVEQVFGGRGLRGYRGLEGCIRFQENPANVSDVSFESITGFDDGHVDVTYTKIGGSDDGLRIEEKLFFDEELGHWRLWSSDEAESAG